MAALHEHKHIAMPRRSACFEAWETSQGALNPELAQNLNRRKPDPSLLPFYYDVRTIIKIVFLILSWALYEQKFKKITPKETTGNVLQQTEGLGTALDVERQLLQAELQPKLRSVYKILRCSLGTCRQGAKLR